MTRDEIAELARESGFWIEFCKQDKFARFAQLVAHKERERIANMVDELGDGEPVWAWWVAGQIRAR